MVVGLGSGTTMMKVVQILARMKSSAVFIPSSSTIQRLASDLGLELSSLDVHDKLDLMIDGADEVDANFDMIKGRGGAHTREKIVAGAAKHVVIVVDRTKLVRRLGERAPVPVEILPFAVGYTIRKLGVLGKPILRLGASGEPFLTDNGNYVVDVKFRSISVPSRLEKRINNVPGVVENGLFVGMADEVVVGHEDGYTILKSKMDFLRFMRGKI